MIIKILLTVILDTSPPVRIQCAAGLQPSRKFIFPLLISPFLRSWLDSTNPPLTTPNCSSNNQERVRGRAMNILIHCLFFHGFDGIISQLSRHFPCFQKSNTVFNITPILTIATAIGSANSSSCIVCFPFDILKNGIILKMISRPRIGAFIANRQQASN